jgi:hypothetical protein
MRQKRSSRENCSPMLCKQVQNVSITPPFPQGYAGHRKSESRPRGLSHLSRPLPSPPYKKRKEKEKGKRTSKRPRTFASGAFMASSSIHCFAPNKSSCKRKSSSGALMASYSYRLPISVSSKNSSTASVILSSLKRSTTFNRAPRSFLCCPRPLFFPVIFFTLLLRARHSRFHARHPQQVTARLFPS